MVQISKKEKKKGKKKKKIEKKHLVEDKRNLIKCNFCGYKISKPFPKDQLCPNPKCRKFLAILHEMSTEGKEKVQPKQFETKASTITKLQGKAKLKEKSPEENFKISLESEIHHLKKGEYVKLLGITSVDRTQLYCSNDDLRYLLELTNNLDFIATGILGGELDKMRLISVEQNTEEKCQFYVKDGIIYLVYGKFPDKKGKWLLEQMSNYYSDLVGDRDVNNLNKLESHQIERDFRGPTKLILEEYCNLQDVFSDKKIPYVEDTIRIDYLGLSSMSIGVISLLLGDDLNVELQIEVDNPEEVKEMKESMITARVEAIAANTQGNTGAFPRWISVKLGFQKYRFLSFKKYQNDYFLSLLSEGNLEKIEEVEKLLDSKVGKVTESNFSGNLKPFNELKGDLKNTLEKRRKFPPFEFKEENHKQK
ncbi:MAG: hypothetical protein ACFFBC_06460 [Promethearchaeota archaeon]